MRSQQAVPATLWAVRADHLCGQAHVTRCHLTQAYWLQGLSDSAVRAGAVCAAALPRGVLRKRDDVAKKELAQEAQIEQPCRWRAGESQPAWAPT